MSGTSSSSALVAGAVALLLGATSIPERVSGSKRVELVKECLYSTAEDLGDEGQDVRYGWGLVDVSPAPLLPPETGATAEPVVASPAHDDEGLTGSAPHAGLLGVEPPLAQSVVRGPRPSSGR